MFPEVGATELLLIAAVALIVVGPKDLPILMRKVGQFMAKMRGMANEFRASFDEMARQSELDELRREVHALRSGQYLDEAKAAAQSAFDVNADDVVHEIEEDHRAYAEPEVPAEPAPAPKPRKPRAKAKSSSAANAPAKPRAPRKAKPPPEAEA
jgi:sec-independent protein translocase protein TatB